MVQMGCPRAPMGCPLGAHGLSVRASMGCPWGARELSVEWPCEGREVYGGRPLGVRETPVEHP